MSTATKAVALEEDTVTSWGSNLRGLGHNNYLGKILNARVYEAGEWSYEIARDSASACATPRATAALMRGDAHARHDGTKRGRYRGGAPE